MFNVGKIVTIKSGARYPLKIVNSSTLINDCTYKILEVLSDKRSVIVESIITGNTYRILIRDLELVENFNNTSIEQAIENLYNLIIIEKCSQELQSKFWDLHKALADREKEISDKLDDIKKLL